MRDLHLTLPELRRALVRTCKLMYEKGWTANHDGNVSVRLPAGRVLVSPTSMSKADICEADLVEVDLEGRVLGGARRPPSELALHLKAYSARADVGAVVHAHPPVAVAHAVSGLEIPTTMMPEPVVSIGPVIPLVPFAMPGSADLHAAVEQASRVASCLLLEHHGPLTMGTDLEQAWLRMELVEHLALIHTGARRLGSVRTLSSTAVSSLAQKHRKAGLAPPQS